MGSSEVRAVRKSLTPKERAAMIERQGFACFTFGCTGKPAIAEHWVCVALGNDAKPDCMLCRDCAKEKTRLDMGRIAKVKRLRRGPKKSKRPMRSRGFPKGVRKKMSGEVVKR